MKTVALIQARMTSIRLPGKVMAEVAGRPLLDHVVKRAQQARTLDLVVVATSDQPADDVVARFCAEADIPCFRGSEDDVLDRYYQAAKHYAADAIVRLTADCPLLDPAVIDKVVRAFQAGDYDYVSNVLPPTYPDGLDTEVFRWDALERAWREACFMSQREHVTSYICEQPTLFRLGNVEHDPDLSALRWTVDEPQDLEFVRRVYGYLGPVHFFGMAEILALLREHPELNGINAGFQRNEGYLKSLREDTIIEKGAT
jgi:spore coat polysaccharide biosynthesis protein SpsF (cytidylyltransferase family)